MPTHTRIRMFNTKETYPNQSLDNDLCQAVRAGNTVYVRGQVGTDFAGNLVGLGDPQAQAEQAMKNVKQLLEEAGSDLSHIVKTTTYIIDPRYREPVYQEVGKWLKGVFPISTGLVISALAQPQWLMEIDDLFYRSILPGKRAVWYCAQLLQHCRRRPLSLATGRGGGGIQSEHHVTGAGSAGVSATGTGIRAGHRVAQGAGGGRF